MFQHFPTNDTIFKISFLQQRQSYYVFRKLLLVYELIILIGVRSAFNALKILFEFSPWLPKPF